MATNLSLTLIPGPDPFIVHFQENNSTLKSIKNIALSIFPLIHTSIKSLYCAFYATVIKIPDLFKEVVLGYREAGWENFYPPDSPGVVVFRIFIFVFRFFWDFLKRSIPLFLDIDGMKKLNLRERGIFDDRLNLSHIQTARSFIKADHVPAHIQVENILTVFDEANFDRKEELGYIAVGNKEECRQHLGKFIYRVKTKHIECGTPSEGIDLDNFYKNLENGARCCLYDRWKKIQDFQNIHGKDIRAYNPSQKNQYGILLQEQARFLVELSIASAVCGGRWGTEVRLLFEKTTKKEGDSLSDLKGRLIEILADARKEMCDEEAHFLFYKNDPHDLGIDVHAYNTYFHYVSKLFGVPYYQDFTEQLLVKNFDVEMVLKRLAQKYTPKFVIDTIQAELKKEENMDLFDTIGVWIREQVGDWGKRRYEKHVEDNKRIIHEAKDLELILRRLNKRVREDIEADTKEEECFIGIDSATIKSILANPASIDEILQNWAFRIRSTELYPKLDIRSQKDGLPIPILEWLLIKNGILKLPWEGDV